MEARKNEKNEARGMPFAFNSVMGIIFVLFTPQTDVVQVMLQFKMFFVFFYT